MGGEVAQRALQRLEGALRVEGTAGVDSDRAALLLDPDARPGPGPVEEAGELGADRGDARF